MISLCMGYILCEIKTERVGLEGYGLEVCMTKWVDSNQCAGPGFGHMQQLGHTPTISSVIYVLWYHCDSFVKMVEQTNQPWPCDFLVGVLLIFYEKNWWTPVRLPVILGNILKCSIENCRWARPDILSIWWLETGVFFSWWYSPSSSIFRFSNY